MRKSIFAMLTLLIAIGAPSNTVANGGVVGKIYSTDIVAYVGENEVPSYNIGGRTAIVLEDLCSADYGCPFRCYYDDSQRLLTVTGRTPWVSGSKVQRGAVGRTVGDVYDTDIRVMLNGIDIQGYNIGGKTAVCIEDIGSIAESPNESYGYSKYAAKFEWNENERKVSLAFADKFYPFSFVEIASKFNYTFDKNVIKAEYSDMNVYRGAESCAEPIDEMGVIQPLYLELDGTREKIGICYANSIGSNLAYALDDADALAQKLNAYKESKKTKRTYDEILQLFDDGVNYKMAQKFDTEDYTMLLSKSLKDGDIVYVAVKKSGDFTVITHAEEYSSTVIKQVGDAEVEVTVSPFAGLHGSTSMSARYDLAEYFD